jgi:cyclopropane-fatty-acyl-phospholipid synthase
MADIGNQRPQLRPARLGEVRARGFHGVRGTVTRLLASAGIEINGRAATDPQVHDDSFYSRVLAGGSLGLGESYMDGAWDVRDLVGFVHRLLVANLDVRVWNWHDAFAWVRAVLINQQSSRRAFEVGKRHYDLGNDLYEGMLDRRMIYSCAYWNNAESLDAAQEAKLDLVFGKLGLAAGQRVLDVGCGWGGALRYAVEKYGVAHGTGITIASEQVDYARAKCRGLPIDIRLQDYRDLNESFDHIWSIGMFEHVGVSNYRRYMRVMRRCLRPGGRFLLHTIGTLRSTNHTDPWIHKYIFPNSMLPSQQQIASAIAGLFLIDGWQRIGGHYERTLLAWRANFERHCASRDGRFRRMWNFYLSACAAAFRAKKLDVWQVLLVPVGW